jgi:hypothetical protein
MAKKGRLSRTHNEPPGMFDDDMVDKDEHGFYVKSLGILSSLKQRRMTGEDLKRTLQKKGISQMEMDDLGLTGMLSGRDRVDLDDVEAHIEENKPEFELKTLHGDDYDPDWSPNDFDFDEEIMGTDTDVGRDEIAWRKESLLEDFLSSSSYDSGQHVIADYVSSEAHLNRHFGGSAIPGGGDSRKQFLKDWDEVFTEDMGIGAEGKGLDSQEFYNNYSSFLDDVFEDMATDEYMQDPIYEYELYGDDVRDNYSDLKIIGNDNHGYTIKLPNGDALETMTRDGRRPWYGGSLEEARDEAISAAYDYDLFETDTNAVDLYEEHTLGGGDNYQVHSFVIDPRHQDEEFYGTHFDENAMFHARTKDRPTPDGQGKLLYIEELQSDWGKQYRDNPDFMQDRSASLSPGWDTLVFNEKKPPFVTDTKAWTDLAAKQLATYAKENGYDGIAFTPGQVHEKRYGREGKSGLSDQYNKNLMGSMNTIFERPASVFEDPEGFASGSPMWIFDEKDKQKIDKGFSQYVAPIGAGILTGAGITGASLTPRQAYAETGKSQQMDAWNVEQGRGAALQEMMAGDLSGMAGDARRMYGLLSGYVTDKLNPYYTESIEETDASADAIQNAVYGALSGGNADDPGAQAYLGPLQQGEELYQKTLDEYTDPRLMGTYPIDEELYRTNPRLFRILNMVDQYSNPFHVEPTFKR